jgi:hypothetical protein
LLAVVLIVVGAVFVAVAAWVISQYRQRKMMQMATHWIPVEATIESGALEGTRGSGKIALPTFRLSYTACAQYYSGPLQSNSESVPSEFLVND